MAEKSANGPTNRTVNRPTPRDMAKYEAEERTIMQAAYRLIGHNESGPTAVQDILNEAGLSTRAFYRHFASKDDLIVAMYRADSQRVAVELSAAITAAPTPVAAVEAWIDHWLSIAYDPRRAKHLRVLSSAEARNAVGMRAVEGEDGRMSIIVLSQVLAAGRHSGDFPLVQPDDDARAFQAVVAALIEARIHRESTPSWPAARAHLCSLMGRALGCPLGD